ncbi:MAG TPA: aldolase/citrate lyase family protein [Bryobacteraceae bacterium]|jgi:2-keto-3-deoxy-L-rhamnonate aldolase RhmA|nr:aldolase/citrate lyase family protein [Bryobacteraceae bacterium]
MNRFHSALARGRKPLLGASIYFYNPLFLEIVAELGYDVLWIEMEHAFITFAEAADLCRMAHGRGLLTMIRVPDARRESVLKAAECGPDMIDLPMVDSPAQVQELLGYARFPPLGQRGFFSVSRSLNYGLVDDVSRAQQELNEQLALLVQVETAEALERVDELCAMDGVDIFIGPADLSASLGLPGQTSHPRLLDAARHITETAKKYGRRVATAVNHRDAAPWIEMGVDLIFCANDIVCLRNGASEVMRETSALRTRSELAGAR